ncbi:CMP-N-acetylneuraminate-beta-galactosamide-alpha-2,3-sialyltransferase 1-like [Dunckerocampus dactyliophorus]|uniref:CMP-N-acetylneuraminate-beta-galactosamide- alpha-2,3-sialyltransferase 1-like n=1 Tax=Dunckerocampus dactyliophorus TaxID=161453 RepID=UPI0024073D99|nr:CMP-N-acetylneuraminate-beta-galactosamide-alpha-2,3-sialyltransferase 1-like [Dunckerocampus dactyliophorus]
MNPRPLLGPDPPVENPDVGEHVAVAAPWLLQVALTQSFVHSVQTDLLLSDQQLQFERRSFTSYQRAVDGLLKTFPSISKVAEVSLVDRRRTCAVVGNSVNLKGSRYGHLIDAHDVVLRMNYAPTKGYEEDVGTKTSHRLMYPESALDLNDSTHLVLLPFKILDLEWLQQAFTTGFNGTSYKPVRATIRANKSLVMVVNPGFIAYVNRAWLGMRRGYPSTGFLAVILALHMCDEVHVFGYGADRNGNWSHYWGKVGENPNFKTGLHHGKHEYHMLRTMAVHQQLKFFRGCFQKA